MYCMYCSYPDVTQWIDCTISGLHKCWKQKVPHKYHLICLKGSWKKITKLYLKTKKTKISFLSLTNIHQCNISHLHMLVDPVLLAWMKKIQILGIWCDSWLIIFSVPVFLPRNNQRIRRGLFFCQGYTQRTQFQIIQLC